MSIIYTSEQQDGIDICSDTANKIACVTGQAGTGKTTILERAYTQLVDEFNEKHNYDPELSNSHPPYSIKLAAPTGRAAKRIEEITGLKALTIHRMMRFTVPKDDEEFSLPKYSKQNRMPFDAIFIDEASMLTETLRRQIIDAMKPGCIIRFFGDINQLPPIGSLSPFAKDLQKFPSVTLTHNFRSTDGIISISDDVIKNKIPKANSQVQIIKCVSAAGSRTVMDLAKTIDFTLPANQIICPTKATKHGCQTLNTLIQQRFNPEKEKIHTYQKTHDGVLITRAFKRGDKIIWDKNDYNLELMNGTIGQILDFDTETGEIIITVEDKDVIIPISIESFNPTTGARYTYDPRNSLMLAYAITTHKSQGSQFKHVCFAVSNSRAAVRQNVYTAVTRAQETLTIIDIGNALHRAIQKKAEI